MDSEYSLALGQVGQVNVYLTVEAACAEQCLVEHIDTVGGGKDDDAGVGAEAVHLGKEGVECILALIIASHARVLAACAAYGVDFVDKDNGGRLLLCLGKGVADAGSSHSDKHLHEIRTRHGEERYACLSSHSLGKQRLTRSRRTDKKGSLGYLAAKVGIFLRVLQEVNYLLHLLLGSLLPCHVLERDAERVALLQHLCLGTAYAEDAHSA